MGCAALLPAEGDSLSEGEGDGDVDGASVGPPGDGGGADSLSEGDSDGVSDGVSDGDSETVDVLVSTGDAVCDRVGVGDTGDRDVVGVAVRVLVSDGVVEIVADGVTVRVGVAVIVGSATRPALAHT